MNTRKKPTLANKPGPQKKKRNSHKPEDYKLGLDFLYTVRSPEEFMFVSENMFQELRESGRRRAAIHFIENGDNRQILFGRKQNDPVSFNTQF